MNVVSPGNFPELRPTPPLESLRTNSTWNEDLSNAYDVVVAEEYRSNVARLRKVTQAGLVLWLVVGLPSDISIVSAFPDANLVDILLIRFAVFFAILASVWRLRRRTLPSLREFRWLEAALFPTTCAGLAAFMLVDLGPRSSTINYVSAILIAQGISIPRPFREGLREIGKSAFAALLVLALGATFSSSFRQELLNPATRSLFSFSVYLMLVVSFIVVTGSHSAWQVRRESFRAKRVGSYRLQRKIGEGAMGEVWLAEHPGLRQKVALKLLKSSHNADLRKRFLREVEATSMLSHPNTVRVLDRGITAEGLYYYSMEYIEGETLRERVERKGPMPIAQALHVAKQITRALAEAHDHGIVHRDVNPNNVLLTRVGADDDIAKLCDFGVATVHEKGDAHSNTEEMQAVGSPAFAAPEQMRGAPAEASADVYSLAATFGFACTGLDPLKAHFISNLQEVGIYDILCQALEADPERRPVDARAFAKRLHAQTGISGLRPAANERVMDQASLGAEEIGKA